MTNDQAWIIGLKLCPRLEQPEWYTLWFEDDERKLLIEDGRIVWVRSLAEARPMVERRTPGPVALADEPAGLCDIPELFDGLAQLKNGRGLPFLKALNALDDLYLGVGSIGATSGTGFAAEASVAVLDRVRDGLMEGPRRAPFR